MNRASHRHRLGNTAAVVTALLSVAAALTAGHLVAALTEPRASPHVAVGNAAIDLAPRPVKELAIDLFGTSDKLALLVGMGLVIVLLATAGGLASRRTPLPGSALITGFGVLGLVAAASRVGPDPLALTAPLTATLVGLGFFGWLHRTAASSAPGSEAVAAEPRQDAAEDETTGFAGTTGGRRRFLISGASVALASGAAGTAGELLGGARGVSRSREAVELPRPDVEAPPLPAGADFARSGTPSFITPNSEFYRIDTALRVPRVPTSEWRLRVHGMVEREIELTFDELTSRRLLEKPITMTCVSNPVGGSYVSTAEFLGVAVRDLLAEAGVRDGAEQVLSTSVDGFTAGTPIEALTDPDRDALLAVGMNGEPLPVEHGFPVRMVTPGLYGYVSATKWLTDLEVTTWDNRPYWAKRGWALRAPVKTQSRIDRPAGFEKIPAGRITVAGIAWAQHTGVERVEVRVDEGRWRRAELSEPVNSDTWRMWRIELDLPPGGHTVESRATDRSGYTQTAKRAPTVPDGATGWHSVFFTAR
ncbi:molybdopterin-binding protein [Actinopolyspora erythraea]|uniref:Molybdopterin-binding protein n=1 Tax=Actinopolyspora erythraea TaxID=414996 RepID=A0A223RRI5_9ACTN|nr:molybdopterin-dependent oxidoreductase [Actinopolyspora erythraea]ASU78486.1 molybdopterin-binding protein [Actinopolyspora erythraea]